MNNVDINIERMLARTLALRAAREFIASYIRTLENDFPSQIESTRNLLKQIDEALK
jgi:hypothetical protein